DPSAPPHSAPPPPEIPPLSLHDALPILPYTEVVSRNVLRNALITPITVLGLRVGYLMGGAVIIEIIFNIQAMGQLILGGVTRNRSEEHTSELQSRFDLVCRLLLEKKNRH